MSSSSSELLGAHLLKEVEDQQGSLEDLLKDLRSGLVAAPRTGIAVLDELWRERGANTKLNITGSGLPLLHHILAQVITRLTGTIVVVDLDDRFSPSHLETISRSDLQHIHVFRATPSNLQVTLDSIESYMLYGDHKSKERVWYGIIVIGGAGGNINLAQRGWLRVEKDVVPHFRWGISVEEAMEDRDKRWEAVEGKEWKGVCDMTGKHFYFTS